MSGHGVFKFAGGNRYDGEFQDDAFGGHGTKTWTNGDRYEGEWRDGRANGSGHLFAGGVAYDGIWADGCLATDKGWVAIDVDASTCH
jgi:hypothetical protein